MALAPIRIPTLTQAQPFVDKDGRLTVFALRTLNSILQSLGDALNQLLVLPIIQEAIANLNVDTEALAAATAAAQAAADNANAAASTVTDQSNLANSYVSGLTLSATDAGTTATIAVSAHTRVYGDDSTVPVSASNVTDLEYETLYYIYYEDPTRAGGAVEFLVTENAAEAAQIGNRHVVGSITTPAALAPATPGNPVLPPGSGSIERNLEP